MSIYLFFPKAVLSGEIKAVHKEEAATVTCCQHPDSKHSATLPTFALDKKPKPLNTSEPCMMYVWCIFQAGLRV